MSTKILLWFLLNVGLLSVLFLAGFRSHFRLGLDSLVLGRAGERLEAVGEVLRAELDGRSREVQDNVLRRYSEAYRVHFSVHRDGRQLAGEPIPLPKEVGRVAALQPWPLAWRGGTEGTRLPALGTGPVRPFPKKALRSANPTRYWALLRLPLSGPESGQARPATLVLMSESMRFGGLLFDYPLWLGAGLGGFLLSVLLWLPLVRGITQSIAQLTAATGQIAEGHFDVRVPERRSDELGTLARSINRLAAQLAAFVTGQKRFLGDVAHELRSPLARIHMVSGVLEERVGAAHQNHLADLREELQQMSSLVNELLAFSKAGLRGTQAQLQDVRLATIVQRAVEREAQGSQVEVRVPPNLVVRAEPELLTRALANLLRNAVRYAGSAGPVTVSAQPQAEQVSVLVSDCGPGVPSDAIDHMFTPFFRPDPARSRETGGVGLGLAIVRTCIQTCGGSVVCRNLVPKGFEVEMFLARVR